MKSMSRRGGTATDPALITDIDSWLRYYTRGSRNVVYHEGTLLVLDSARMATSYEDALANPVKRIAIPKSYDYVSLLRDPATPEALRASATEKRETTVRERSEHTATAQRAFLEAEQELLEAIEARATLTNPAERIATTVAIGNLMKAVGEADRTYRDTMYNRGIVYEELEKGLIFPGTRDKRKMRNLEGEVVVVGRITLATHSPQELSVPLL